MEIGSPPRVWGIRLVWTRSNFVTGSPPRVWGIPLREQQNCGNRRFTPTCVGNTKTAFPFSPVGSGSPPRVWGIRVRVVRGIAPLRFTPTCVGNTTKEGNKMKALTVHPHVCGEYPNHAASILSGGGSPPRVWGIRYLRSKFSSCLRFTPTCVGNTTVDAPVPRITPVHPHVCGEYLIVTATQFADVGSPPRVWGIRAAYMWSIARYRFTPTCVGNTYE